MASIDFPFNFAAYKDTIKKFLPGYTSLCQEIYYLRYKYVMLYELQMDCGCIYITNLHYLTNEIYKEIEEFAAAMGYSKILCTLSEEYGVVSRIIKLLEENGFSIVETGFSNRSTNDNKDDKYTLQTWLCFKVIIPKIKGYV
jgi:hypothetical protein